MVDVLFTNAIGTVYVNTQHERHAARLLHFERCRGISLTYTAFQEADGDGFVESIGKALRREAEGASFWGCGAMSDPLKAFLILTSFTKEVG